MPGLRCLCPLVRDQRAEASRVASADGAMTARTHGPSSTRNVPRSPIRMITCSPHANWPSASGTASPFPSPGTRPVITPRLWRRSISEDSGDVLPRDRVAHLEVAKGTYDDRARPNRMAGPPLSGPCKRPKCYRIWTPPGCGRLCQRRPEGSVGTHAMRMCTHRGGAERSRIRQSHLAGDSR